MRSQLHAVIEEAYEVSIDDPPDNGGVDICDVIDRFFDEYMRSSLERTDLVLWPVGGRLAFDLSDVLTLIVTAHGDLQRALAVWEAADDPCAAIHMAAMRGRVLCETDRTCFHSAYFDDYPRLQQLVSDAVWTVCSGCARLTGLSGQRPEICYASSEKFRP